MLISNAQLSGIAGSAEGQFVSSLMAQQAKAFPQLQGIPAPQLAAQTAASIAVAQFHGFSKQSDIAVCARCMTPFLVGAANPAKIQGEGSQPLQTLIADTRSVLSKLEPSSNAAVPTGEQVAALARQCASLAAATGSSPLNTDRSGPVIPPSAAPLVKAVDLVAPASSALPPKGKAPDGAITQDQVSEAAAEAQKSFPNTVLGSVVQNCKQLVDLEFRRVYWDGTPIPNIPYTVTLSDSSTRSGTTDANGLGAHTSVPPGSASVVYGENKNPAKGSVGTDADPDFQELFSYLDGGVG